jgi:hypothetical protein
MKYHLTLFLSLPLFLFAQTGPGGVGDATTTIAWLRSGEGLSSTTHDDLISHWNDQLNSHNAGQAGGARPVLKNDAATNLNTVMPLLKTDGVSKHMTIPSHADINLDNAGYNERSIYLVFKTGADIISQQLVYEEGGRVNGFVFEVDGGQAYLSSHKNGAGGYHHDFSTGIVANTPYIAAYIFSANDNEINAYLNSTNIGGFAGALVKMPKHSGAVALGSINGRTVFHDDAVGTGSSQGSNPQVFEGDYAEFILFDKALNKAERIIIDNYLSAKFNISIDAVNDLYTQDDAASGNYDFNVAGIGRADDGSANLDAMGTSRVGINSATSLDNDDFLFWGCDDGIFFNDPSADKPGFVQSRIDRVWRFQEVGDIGNVNIRVDLSGLGSVVAGDLRLLLDLDNDGVFSDEIDGVGSIGGAVYLPALPGEVYEFSGVDPSGSIRFTIGSTNRLTTPLPIELISFDAHLVNGETQISWTTATEVNNDYFELERSADGINFEVIMTVQGAGNSTQQIEYFEVDQHPLAGVSYYRLKQTDFDGSTKTFNLVPVQNTNEAEPTTLLFPNPVGADRGEVNLLLEGFEGYEVLVMLRDIRGRTFFSKVNVIQSGSEVHAVPIDQSIPAGTYLVTASSNNSIYSKQLVIE